MYVAHEYCVVYNLRILDSYMYVYARATPQTKAKIAEVTALVLVLKPVPILMTVQ